jgi:tetratricopeptide (TPR) repeat protein
MKGSSISVTDFARIYSKKNADFIKNDILETPPADIDEYAAMNAFSWVKSAAEYLESSMGATNGPSNSGYMKDVTDDTNFFNPASINMMSDAYHIDNAFISCSRYFKDLLSSEVWTMDGLVASVKLGRSNDKLNRGIALTRSQKYGDAISNLAEAIDIYPTANAYVARGAAYANIGALVLAVDDFRYALLLDPSHSNAQVYLSATTEKMTNMKMPAMLPSLPSEEKTPSDAINACADDTAPASAVPSTMLIVFSDSISRLKEFISSSGCGGSDDDDISQSSYSKEGKEKKRKRSSSDRKEHSNKKKTKKHHHSSKKEKKNSKSAHHEKKSSSKKKRKQGTPILDDCSSSNSEKSEAIHPILQREPHKLWG